MDENKDLDFSKAITKITPRLKTLSKIYSIPFEEVLKIIKDDREKALENYKIFKELIDAGDDRQATKEGLNNAMELVIKSTEKLTVLINSAAKLMGDTVKAMAIKSKNEEEDNKKFIEDIRMKIISEEDKDDKS